MSLRKWVKRVGRKAAPVAYKVGRVVTPVAGAVAGYFAGPVGGAVVGAIGGSAGYYARATTARAEGTRGRAARELGRGERKRQFIYGLAGGAAGALGSGVTALAAGQGVGTAATSTLFGQGGQQLLFGGSAVLAPSSTSSSGFVTQSSLNASLAAGKAGGVPGLVTQSGLEASLAAGGGTAGTTGTTAALLGAASTVLNQWSLSRGTGQGTTPPGTAPGTNAGGYEGSGGSAPWGTVNAGGDGGPGMSPGALAALLLVGAVILAG